MNLRLFVPALGHSIRIRVGSMLESSLGAEKHAKADSSKDDKLSVELSHRTNALDP